MAKQANKPKEKAKRGNYDEKLQVNGSFMDIMKAAVKHREAQVKKKKQS